MDKNGVPELISALCLSILKSMVKKDDLSEKETNDIVSHLKTKSFHTLLNEKRAHEKNKFAREFHNDIETELMLCQISFLVNNDLKKAAKLKSCISKIDTKSNENVLKLLLIFMNKNICDIEQDESENSFFRERESYEYILDLPPFTNNDNQVLSLKKFDDSPYVDKNLLELQYLTELFIEDDLPNFFCQNLKKNKQEHHIDYSTNVPTKTKSENVWDMLLDENLTGEFSEDLNDNNFLNNLNMLFESDMEIIYVVWKIVLRNRSNLVSRNIETEETLNVIDSTKFLIDAQNVLVGIESSSFLWSEEDGKFRIKSGLCVKGLLPHTFNLLCEDLIISGTLFSRLYSLLTPNKENGYTFNDLCLQLPNFLNFYRSNVLLFKGNNLSEFKVYVRKLVEIIQSVSRCFFIDIYAKKTEIWKGISLLNNIYREFVRTTKNDYLFIIHYFLYHCFQNYFRRFVKPWIMDGVLIDPYNEFFVKKNTNFTQYRNRKYWTQGFKVSSDTIPVFLKEYIDLILLCGKSVCLVKHCFQNSEETFVYSNSLEMNVCATESQLGKLKILCEQNHELVMLKNGPLRSFQDLFAIENKRAIDLQLRAAETQAESLLNIQKQMKAKRAIKMQEKQKLWDEYQNERKTNQLIKDLMISQEIRRALVEYNEEKYLQQDKARLLQLEKEELRKQFANLTKTLELKQSLVDNRISLLETYLNKNSLTLPLHKTSAMHQIDNTINYENSTNLTNLDQNLFNDVNETKLTLICDNLTTPTNNNLLWDTNKTTNDFKNTDFEDNLKSIISIKNENSCEQKYDLPEKKEVNLLFQALEILTEENNSTESSADSISIEKLDVNPYIDYQLNFDNEKLEPVCDIKWEALNQEEKVENNNNGIDIDYLKRQKQPVKPFDVLKIIYARPTGKIVNNGTKKQISIPDFISDDLNLSNCKFFDLHAEQSILVPLNSQLSLLNECLMKHFLNDFKILNHFHTLSNFFFFFNSEYKHNFTQQLFDLLYQANYPKEVFNLKTLYEIVTFSVNTNNLAHLEFKDRISLQLISMPSVLNLQSVELLDCLTLTYQVEWPLNIIFTDKVLQKYNKIFQYLLKLRRVQWVLNDLFNRLKFSQKEMNFDDRILMGSQHFKGMHLMRHIMNTWLTLMLCHVTEVVLHSSWFEFEKNLTKAKTIDDIYHMHKEFIKEAVFRCSLNDNSEFFMQKVNQAFELIFQFHELFCNRQFYLRGNYYYHPNYYKLQLCFSNFKEMMRYIIKLCEKQVRKEYQPHLDQIINIINFNNFFDLEN